VAKPLESADSGGELIESDDDLFSEVGESKKDAVADAKEDAIQINVVEDVDSGSEISEELPEEVDENADVTEEELRQYSKSVQKRINTLTSKHHTERREKEKAVGERDQAADAAKQLIGENNRLKNLINKGEHVLVDEAKSRLSTELKSTQTALTAALDAGDSEAITAAQSELARVMAQTERVNSYRPQELPQTEYQESKLQPDEKADAWRSKNKWFAKDSEMTAYAMGLHQKLVNEDFVNPKSDEYYEEIDKNLRLRFPERFKMKRAPRKTVVSPAQRSTTGARSVTLSESQVKLARRLGVTNEQYAAEVLKEKQS